jgi:UTP--glucose-1-phosphate uridylyltransferase
MILGNSVKFMNQKKIRTAVIPVAGKGTRFLPVTKSIPKEMLPIIDRPMIEYAVREAVESGIEKIIFVNSMGKNSIEDYFDRHLELESFLKEKGKTEQCRLIKDLGALIEVVTVRQKEQLGLGHAINCARDLISEEYFAVILADDIIRCEKPVTQQLIEIHEMTKTSVIGVMNIPLKETSKYGVISGEKDARRSGLWSMTGMVEKPAPDQAPTTLATPGRYILHQDIFRELKTIPRGTGGEYQLTDAIHIMANRGEVHAYEYSGRRFDTGCILGYLEATVSFALERDDLRADMIDLLKKELKSLNLD